MKKLITYKSGEVFIMNGLTISLQGGVVSEEIDLEGATDEELAKLKINPNDKSLLSTIQKRKNKVL